MIIKRRFSALFFLVFCSIHAQELTEKQFEQIKPYLYQFNQEFFSENDYLKSIVDQDYVPDWEKPIFSFDVDSLFNDVKKESTIEFQERTQEGDSTKNQRLELVAKWKSKKGEKIKFKIELIANQLKDKSNQDLHFKDTYGLRKGSGVNDSLQEEYLSFNLKENVISPVTGKIRFKISFITSYKVLKVNDFLKDSIFEFQNSKYKIIAFKDNYIRFVGLDSLSDSKAENIEYVNLDQNLKEVIPLNEYGESNDNSEISDGFVSSPSVKASLPSYLLEDKVRHMSFEEYSKYLDSKRKTVAKKIHIIKFNTKIRDLYFFEECYDVSTEFEMDINHAITVSEE